MLSSIEIAKKFSSSESEFFDLFDESEYNKSRSASNIAKAYCDGLFNGSIESFCNGLKDVYEYGIGGSEIATWNSAYLARFFDENNEVFDKYCFNTECLKYMAENEWISYDEVLFDTEWAKTMVVQSIFCQLSLIFMESEVA